MNGRIFVTALLLFMLAFILFAVLFGLYPPAANSWWTALGVVIYAAISVLIVRRVARP
jgi:hypothetical protein